MTGVKEPCFSLLYPKPIDNAAIALNVVICSAL